MAKKQTVDTGTDFADDYDDLFTGPNTVTQAKRRDGKVFFYRTGTRPQRNNIETKYLAAQNNGGEGIYDAVLFCCYLRLSNPDGTQKYKHMDFKQEFCPNADIDKMAEMAAIIRANETLDPSSLDTIDDHTRRHLGNSESHSDAS